MARSKSNADPLRDYAAVVCYWANSTNPQLMADDNGKVVVFDNKRMAQHFLPLLGDGRIASWSPDGESIGFSPISTNGINRAEIIVPYPVYDLPPNHPVLSETKGSHMGWKHHIHFGEWGDNITKKNERLRKLAYDELVAAGGE